MKHAYYLAAFDTTLGDEEYKTGLKDIYLSFCSDFYMIVKGSRQSVSSHFCGVSRYDKPDGSVYTVLIVKNFFNTDPRAFHYHEIR